MDHPTPQTKALRVCVVRVYVHACAQARIHIALIYPIFPLFFFSPRYSYAITYKDPDTQQEVAPIPMSITSIGRKRPRLAVNEIQEVCLANKTENNIH